ncbi:hypothetical protein EN35_02265 [Rhodococcus qingshengii]|nr:hypothetical protein EN35_02265 [Rhodococcus qingshengii]
MRSLGTEFLLLITLLVLLGSSIVGPIQALQEPVAVTVRPVSDAAYPCGSVADPDFTRVRWADEENANDSAARRVPPLEPLCVQTLDETKKHVLALSAVPALTGVAIIVSIVRMMLAFTRRNGTWDEWKLLPPMTNPVAISVAFAAMIMVLVTRPLQ